LEEIRVEVHRKNKRKSQRKEKASKGLQVQMHPPRRNKNARQIDG